MNFALVPHLFIFLFLTRRKSRQVENCFDPYPFTCHRWHFSARPCLSFLCPLPPNCEAYGIFPRFCQSGHLSRWSWSFLLFVFFVIRFLVSASCRTFVFFRVFHCFSNLKQSFVLLIELLYFIFNTIQCGVCHRVAKKKTWKFSRQHIVTFKHS